MGFGTYDESEQEKQEVDTEGVDEEGVKADEAEHEGEMEYEGMDDTDELLNRLEEIKDEQGDDE